MYSLELIMGLISKWLQDGGHSSSRTNSFSLDTSSDNKHVTSPTRQYSDESKRIIPGLHTTTKPSSNRYLLGKKPSVVICVVHKCISNFSIR